MKRLAILSTHPIQYNAPLFRVLHEEKEIKLHVFFSKTWSQVKYDPDFQREVEWDIPIADGYDHSTFDASTHHGKGELAHSIELFKPHALLVYGWNFPGHLAMMRKFHGCLPIWFRGDSHMLNPLSPLKRLLRKLALTFVYRHVDLAFSVGSANNAYFLAAGLLPQQIILAPHAVDNAFWSSDGNSRKAQAKAWKKELSIPDGAKVIGYAGKIEALKQVGKLAKSMESLDNVHLVIAGSGPLLKDIQAKHKSSDNIHFLGFVNQSKMPVFYRMLDLLALVSYSETWGLCINEAIASGTRCLVSDRVGCGPDIFISGPFGSILPWDGAAQSWSNSISEALQSPSLKAIQVSGFTSRFNHDRMAESIKSHLT